MYGCPTSLREISSAIDKHGPAPAALSNLKSEILAANEAISSGLYISWLPHPSVPIGPSAADEIKEGRGQCCRVSMLRFVCVDTL